MNKQKLENAKLLFFIALGLDMAVTTTVIIANFWAVGVFTDIKLGTIMANQSTIDSVEFWASFTKVLFFTLICVGLALVHWLGVSYTYAKESLKLTGFVHEGWKTWGWLLPIMNLFKPYKVLDEIYKAGATVPFGGETWKKSAGSGVLLSWWIFWVLAHLLIAIVFNISSKIIPASHASLNQLTSAYHVSTFAFVINLIVAGLWFVVTGNLTRRLLARSSLLPLAAASKSIISPTNMPAAMPLQPSISASNYTDLKLQSQPINTDFAPSAVTTSAASDDLWAQALTEYDSSSRNQGIWARLFSETQGNETMVKANYLRIRVDEMQQALIIEKERLDTEHKEDQSRQQALIEHIAIQKLEYLKLPKAACPKCKKAILVLTAETCIKCRAIFGQYSLYKLIESPESEIEVKLCNWFVDGVVLNNDELNILVAASSRILKIATLESNFYRQTLLHIAAKLENENAIKILMQCGASLEAVDRDRQKPYQKTNNPQIKQLLQVSE